VAITFVSGEQDTDLFDRNRPMEYDTYRDPVGPLSASAQVLFGAISNFVIGLADIPTEVLLDIVSAGKALGHKHPIHLDPRLNWHSNNEDELAGEADSEKRNDQQKEGNLEEPVSSSPNESTNQSTNGAVDQPLDGTGRDSHSDDGSGSDGSSSKSSDASPVSAVDRVRSLRMEKSETMSSQVAPSKPPTFLSKVGNRGGRMSKRFANFVIWLPTDLSLSMSKGFHNAPKIYHDVTVKSTPKVYGIRSGFRAAGQVRSTLTSISHILLT